MGKTFKQFGIDHDGKTIGQMYDVMEKAEYGALMADGHLGYGMPIGGVAAYDNKISVVGVGYDIACGNLAAKTDFNLKDSKLLMDRQGRRDLANTLRAKFLFGNSKGSVRGGPQDHPLFDDLEWLLIPEPIRSRLKERARLQLGSIGGGNHYIDILVDGDDNVWIGVHFGSRGFGYQIAQNFIALSQGLAWGDKEDPRQAQLLSLDNPIGSDYWALMNLAGRYAYAGREWVVQRVADLLGVRVIREIHNNHNFAWKERHHDRDLIVVRKGATPAFPGQLGFVGGSMGDISVILQGAHNGSNTKETWLQKQALFSTVHGAGRLFSRAECKRTLKLDTRDIEDRLGVCVAGAGADESPGAYRPLTGVLEAQGPTITIEEKLYPIAVAMA